MHKNNYTFLTILSTIYIVIVFNYQAVPRYILFATTGFAVLYFVWGIMHHLGAKDFHPRIVLEYLLVALLGVAIIATLLL